MILNIILVYIVLVLVDFHFHTARDNEISYTTLTPQKGCWQGYGGEWFHKIENTLLGFI